MSNQIVPRKPRSAQPEPVEDLAVAVDLLTCEALELIDEFATEVPTAQRLGEVTRLLEAIRDLCGGGISDAAPGAGRGGRPPRNQPSNQSLTPIAPAGEIREPRSADAQATIEAAAEILLERALDPAVSDEAFLEIRHWLLANGLTGTAAQVAALSSLLAQPGGAA